MNIQQLSHLAELRRVRAWADAFTREVTGVTVEHLKYVLSNIDAPRNAKIAQRQFDNGVRTFNGIVVDDTMNVIAIKEYVSPQPESPK